MKNLFITAAVAIMSMSAMAQNVNYQVRWANHPEDAKHYTTDRLRKEFLVEKVFAPNEVNWTYTMYDRFLIGGAEPVDAPIKIEPIEPLLAKTFLENREMGIINIGGPGVVTVDGKKYDLNFQEGIYVGRSTEKNPNNITLSSKDPKNPAKFYMNSATAHTSYPTKLVTLKEARFARREQRPCYPPAHHQRCCRCTHMPVADGCDRVEDRFGMEHNAGSHTHAPYGDLSLLQRTRRSAHLSHYG